MIIQLDFFQIESVMGFEAFTFLPITKNQNY